MEIPRLAIHANGEALVRMGDTTVLVTAVMSHQPREGFSYFPLMVDYEEKLYAAGRIKGSRFIKREGRASDDAILSARVIDRTIRPRFPKGIRNDIQVVATILSYDDENDPDVLAMIGTSVALSISNIPWNGPIAAVRGAEIDGEVVLNPTQEQRKTAAFEFILSSIEGHVNMVEGHGIGQEFSEESALSAMEKAYDLTQTFIQQIDAFAKEHGEEKRTIVRIDPSEEEHESVREFLGDRLETLLFDPDIPKSERMHKVNDLKEETINHFMEGDVLAKSDTDAIFEDEIDRMVHTYALEKGTRSDGRKLDEVRDLKAIVGYVPRIHGSAVFTRGETTALAAVTLGGPGQGQIIETIEGEWTKRFLLHYNFPAFSVGDVRPMRGPGRRDIGHGNLAERSVEAMMPTTEEFPYMIRVVSEILASNGSSSMATVCAASLALMDAGVPIKKHVAGIAMGVMVDEQPKDPKNPDYVILTDIQGPEDHHGDMDLKIAGTRDGVTGLQMDVKIAGVTLSILKDAFNEAKKARLHILDAMDKSIKEPRKEVAKTAPKVQVLQINPARIGELIGPGGKVIKGITEATGAIVNVEQDGSVYVSAVDPEAFQEAVRQVEAITKEIEPGELYEGPVTRIFPFGAMVELTPGKDGLIHISELSEFNVNHPGDVFEDGMIVPVVVKERDERGRLNLSFQDVKAFIAEHPPKPGRGGPSGGRDGPGGGYRGRGGPRRSPGGPPHDRGTRRY